IAASPMTWILGCSGDSNVIGSIGHHPARSATPATSAIRPARCGGVVLAGGGLWGLKKGGRGTAPVAADGALPAPRTHHPSVTPADSDTHSMSPGYNAVQAFWNSFCFEKVSLASRTISLERGFFAFR